MNGICAFLKKAEYIHIFRFLRINILFFVVLGASIVGEYAIEFLIAYSCALVHECMHIYVAGKFGYKTEYIQIQPFGVCATFKENVIKNPVYETAIAISGPIANGILIATAVFYSEIFGEFPLYDYFIMCNAAMVILNMLPVLPLDGGRVLRAVLSCFTGSICAYKLTLKISRIPIFVMFLTVIYGIMRLKFNFSLIMITAFLLGSILNEQKNISKRAVYEIIESTQKTNDNTPKKGVLFTACYTVPARFIIKHLSLNRCNIVCVTDEYGKILGSLSETQILKGIEKYGIRVMIGDILTADKKTNRTI